LTKYLEQKPYHQTTKQQSIKQQATSNKTMSQTLSLIQSKIDSSKELIGDGVYLEMCNLMKQMYDEKEQEKLHTKILYKVKFILPKVIKNIDDETETNFDIKLISKTVIIQLAKIQFDWIIEAMQNNEHGCYFTDKKDGIGLHIPFAEECITQLCFTDNNANDEVLLIENKEYCITSITPIPTTAGLYHQVPTIE